MPYILTPLSLSFWLNRHRVLWGMHKSKTEKTEGKEMSCYLMSINVPKTLPSLYPPHQSNYHLPCYIRSHERREHNRLQPYSKKQVGMSINSAGIQDSRTKSLMLATHVGGVLSIVAQPAFAVTGVNYEEDLTWVLVQLGISAFLYFIVFPPIIMNWLRSRWYKRNLLEMYLQFMFVFLFFPGVLLWAPFLNFRKFPRDPSMKYPWSTPQNPSQIKGGFSKYPWAQPEDYE